MSSLAMVLNTEHEKISGHSIDPGKKFKIVQRPLPVTLNCLLGTLNSWLTSHGGYVNHDELVWAGADPLGKLKFQHYHTTVDLSLGKIKNTNTRQTHYEFSQVKPWKGSLWPEYIKHIPHFHKFLTSFVA